MLPLSSHPGVSFQCFYSDSKTQHREVRTETQQLQSQALAQSQGFSFHSAAKCPKDPGNAFYPKAGIPSWNLHGFRQLRLTEREEAQPCADVSPRWDRTLGKFSSSSSARGDRGGRLSEETLLEHTPEDSSPANGTRTQGLGQDQLQST